MIMTFFINTFDNINNSYPNLICCNILLNVKIAGEWKFSWQNRLELYNGNNSSCNRQMVIGSERQMTWVKYSTSKVAIKYSVHVSTVSSK